MKYILSLFVLLSTSCFGQNYISIGIGSGISKGMVVNYLNNLPGTPYETTDLGIAFGGSLNYEYYFNNGNVGLETEVAVTSMSDVVQRTSELGFCNSNLVVVTGPIDRTLVYTQIGTGPTFKFGVTNQFVFGTMFYYGNMVGGNLQLMDNNNINSTYSATNFYDNNDFGLKLKLCYRYNYSGSGNISYFLDAKSITSYGLNEIEPLNHAFNLQCTLADGPFFYKTFSSMLMFSFGMSF
ncbi:MAG: hypothetical protein HUJ25_12935 [Crocinitomicaceae bacterium]|nr:hypothetical protein [Crocinitomicaceae bacterium]